MEERMNVRVASTSRASAVLAIAGAAVLYMTLTAQPAAQGTAQPRPRLNQIIEQVEQGMPAFGGKHWRLIEMEHSPYVITEVVRILKELRPEGSVRPTLTPIVRIPLEG